MGGERASSVRRRMNGKACCLCRSSLPPPHVYGERCCARCEAERCPRKRIYIQFKHRDCWDCVFLEADLKTQLPRKWTFTDPARLFEIAERGGYRLNLERRQAIELGIEQGNGEIVLELTAEQYAKLIKQP